ncbi:hypothetical protein BGX31_002560, partial [Mortierella sp. GBA43]
GDSIQYLSTRPSTAASAAARQYQYFGTSILAPQRQHPHTQAAGHQTHKRRIIQTPEVYERSNTQTLKHADTQKHSRSPRPRHPDTQAHKHPNTQTR